MVKAVLTTKIDPAYDDLPEERYHFPRMYLNKVELALGDQIIYYQPRRSSASLSSSGGSQSYFATARISDVVPDTLNEDHFYAYVVDYLEFDVPVPFKVESYYYEAGLQKNDGTTNKGAFGRAVRSISDEEYHGILNAGFVDTEQDFVDLSKDGSSIYPQIGLAEEEEEFLGPREEISITRKFRDRAFARRVKSIYQNKCALTGLALVNGGGRPEVQAAHIKPVQFEGPDSVRNGISLSSSIHWMFDRGLVSLDDDYRILRSKSFPESPLHKLLNNDGYASVPNNDTQKPHREYLRFHRENVFKE